MHIDYSVLRAGAITEEVEEEEEEEEEAEAEAEEENQITIRLGAVACIRETSEKEIENEGPPG